MIADQEIRYCTTADGVKIAYATSGEGPPLLYLTPTVGHLLADWEFPHFRRRYEWLGRMFTVYRFDVRGTGLSQRESFGSVDYLADLKAVVDDSGLLSFVVIADGPAGPRAMPFLVEHGARLSRLLLLNSFASYPEIYGDARFGALIQLLRADWTMFTETISRLVGNWSTDDDAKDYAALMRRSATPESYRLHQEASVELDVTPMLHRVTCPTLVVHNSEGVIPLSAAQTLAAEIPGAQLRMLSRASVFYDFAAQDIAPWMEAFLLGESVPRPAAPAIAATVPASGTAVILFTDVVDSTALTERMGDARFRELSRSLDVGLRGAIRGCGGVTVEAKTLGDGVLATFGSAAQAIDGARRCLALSAASELGLHIGVHAGDVIREGGNVFGGAVNIAARICGLSAPGEILVSDVVRGMARSSAGVVFEDRGEQEMKGVGESVRVYAVRGES